MGPSPHTSYVLQGRLSMANFGKDTNTAHFSIMMGPQPHLNTFYTIFGQVVDGFEVSRAQHKEGGEEGGSTRQLAAWAPGMIVACCAAGLIVF